MFSLYYVYLYFLVDFEFPFEGKTLVLITPAPDHCYFFSYSQTFFALLLVYMFNKFCICSGILRIFWSFHDFFLKNDSSVK